MYFDAADFGHRVKVLREEQGMTQEALALKLGIGITHMGRIERGQKTASIDLMIEIAEIYHVSLDYLITGTNYRANNMKNSLLMISESLRVMANNI